MGNKTVKDKEFFADLSEVAQYLGEPVPQFLKFAAEGRFPIPPRALPPGPVFWKTDIDKWIAEGRPKRMSELRPFEDKEV